MKERSDNYGVRPSLEREALFLVLTDTREKENEVKQKLIAENLNCAVTEIGGTVATLQPTGKLTHSVISAALNTGVIKKDPKAIHAVVHATLEATNSIFVHTNSNASFALKIAMVTDNDWIAIAIFGRTSVNILSEHCRVGLGYMHL
ncbi:HutP family protein [Desulfitobacterium metallireducens]|uniref:Hut operon positive regulatory protein n=1 Tax=Desulfitobacterium metallireducens DSM 15288 TaxID=871968 RepID=W0E995_9FIRM|nr:HutP family protein [Desulfitobacterium metallireducens]AHF06098.1 HutP protein [Desulfitobacterium metallireducens DSM 15288]